MKRNTLKAMLVALVMTSGFGLKAQSVDEAIKLYKYERFSSAKQMLEPLSATDPIANYYLGLCEIGLEHEDAAKTIFQKFPADAANLSGTARILFTEKKTKEASDLVQKIAAKAKKKDFMPLKYAADAITYTNGGDPNAAVELYKKAMVIERTGDLHIAIGDAYRKIQGGGGNAMNNYEYAEDFPEAKSLANYKMGNHWYAAKNYDSALSKYAKASLLDEKNPLPYRDLAAAYYKVGKFEKSAENSEKFLKLSDNSIDDQIQYANALFQAQKYPEAVAKMNELIGKGVAKPYMYRVIGFSQFEMKDYKNAKNNLDLLFAKQDPTKIIPLDYIYYGKILMNDSLTASQANGYFEKGMALDTSADKNYLYRELAETFKTSEDYKSSALWYRKIVESNLPSIQSLDYWWAGVISFFAKEYESSDAMLQKMAQKYPDYKSTYFWMARNLVGWKDKDYTNGAASEMYKKWLGLVNDDPSMKDDLIRAYTYLGNVAIASKDKASLGIYLTKMTGLDPNDANTKYFAKKIATMN